MLKHPIINQVHKTVITDQDKGALGSIRDVLPKVGHFHCSFHRRQNIKKKFGGGDGNTALSCLWMYNLLVKQSTPANINYFHNMYYPQMRPAHTAYLDALLDEQQYPGERCDVGDPQVFMNQQEASSSVGSMNRANKPAHARTAVDAV